MQLEAMPASELRSCNGSWGTGSAGKTTSILLTAAETRSIRPKSARATDCASAKRSAIGSRIGPHREASFQSLTLALLSVISKERTGLENSSQACHAALSKCRTDTRGIESTQSFQAFSTSAWAASIAMIDHGRFAVRASSCAHENFLRTSGGCNFTGADEGADKRAGQCRNLHRGGATFLGLPSQLSFLRSLPLKFP